MAPSILLRERERVALLLSGPGPFKVQYALISQIEHSRMTARSEVSVNQRSNHNDTPFPTSFRTAKLRTSFDRFVQRSGQTPPVVVGGITGK